MANEPTIEQMNEAIARFMNVEPYEDSRYGTLYCSPVDGNTCFNLKYHTSWDWIMPVVIKIKNDPSVRLLLPSNGIEKSVWPYIQATQFMNRRLIKADITGTHKGVYQFITWFNQQKQNDE